jgi:hypothetical protein
MSIILSLASSIAFLLSLLLVAMAINLIIETLFDLHK